MQIVVWNVKIEESGTWECHQRLVTMVEDNLSVQPASPSKTASTNVHLRMKMDIAPYSMIGFEKMTLIFMMLEMKDNANRKVRVSIVLWCEFMCSMWSIWDLSATFGLYISSFVCLCKPYALTWVTIVSLHLRKPLNAHFPVKGSTWIWRRSS